MRRKITVTRKEARLWRKAIDEWYGIESREVRLKKWLIKHFHLNKHKFSRW